MNVFKIVPLSAFILFSVPTLQARAQMPPKMDGPVSGTAMPPVMEQPDDGALMPPVIEEATPEMPTNIPAGRSDDELVDTTTARWVVITGSYPQPDIDLAIRRRDELRDAGFDVLVIDSNAYSKLSDGLWVVVIEAQNRGNALAMVEEVRAEVPDAYAKGLQ